MTAASAGHILSLSGDQGGETQVQAIVGQGKHTYRVDKAWGRRAGGVPAFGVAQGVTGDSRDRIYVFQRSPIAEVLVFDREGRLLTRWGNGQFVTPHGIWMSPQDELYLTDTEDHTVTQAAEMSPHSLWVD